jgi:hypothetical protein
LTKNYLLHAKGLWCLQVFGHLYITWSSCGRKCSQKNWEPLLCLTLKYGFCVHISPIDNEAKEHTLHQFFLSFGVPCPKTYVPLLVKVKKPQSNL